MNFPPTFLDGFDFSAGYASFVNGPNESTQDVSYPADYPGSSHYEPSETFYDDTYIFTSQAPVSDPSSTMLAAPVHTAAGDVGVGQPVPTSPYAPSSNVQNTSTNAPVTAAAPPVSNVAPLASVTQVTIQRRFRCLICPNTFDRLSRADACRNNHLGWKPHVCHGACGNTACNATYCSIENLHRHIRTPAARKVTCTYWCVFRRLGGNMVAFKQELRRGT